MINFTSHGEHKEVNGFRMYMPFKIRRRLPWNLQEVKERPVALVLGRAKDNLAADPGTKNLMVLLGTGLHNE